MKLKTFTLPYLSPGRVKSKISRQKKDPPLDSLDKVPSSRNNSAWQQNYIFIFQPGIKNIPGQLHPEEIGGLIALDPREMINNLQRKKWRNFSRAEARVIAGGEKLSEETFLYPLGTAGP